MVELGWFAEDGVECAPAPVNCERDAAAATAHAHCTALCCTAHGTRMSMSCALCAKPPGRRQNVNAGTLVTASFNVKRAKRLTASGANDEWDDRKTVL